MKKIPLAAVLLTMAITLSALACGPKQYPQEKYHYQAPVDRSGDTSRVN